jgi:hypothetical protein
MWPNGLGSVRVLGDRDVPAAGAASPVLTWLRADAGAEPVEIVAPPEPDAYVIGVRGDVARVLEITATDRQLAIEPSRATAVARVHAATPGR